MNSKEKTAQFCAAIAKMRELFGDRYIQAEMDESGIQVSVEWERDWQTSNRLIDELTEWWIDQPHYPGVWFNVKFVEPAR